MVAPVILVVITGSARAQEPTRQQAPTESQQTVRMTLSESIDRALRVQPAMVQAEGNVDVARAAQREAVGNWLPSLSANSGWSKNSTNRFDPATQRLVSGSATSYSAGLSTSLTLFDGFSRIAQNRSASANTASADAALVGQRFQTMAQTKQEFFSALAANELVAAADLQIQRAAEQLKVSKDKLATGSATRSDTLTAYVNLANARLTRLNAETQRATAEAALARLVGVDGRVSPIPDSTLFAAPAIDTTELRQEVLQHSPTVQQAEANAQAAAAQTAVTRAQYMPSMSVSYSTSYAGPELSQLNNSWSTRLSVSWPLFNGFTRETNMARSNAARQAAEAQVGDARRQAASQLTQQLAALQSAEARIGIAQASRAAADEDLRVQQERYRLGVATIVDMLTSQVNLNQAEVNLIQARLDFQLAKAQIEALAGREL